MAIWFGLLCLFVPRRFSCPVGPRRFGRLQVSFKAPQIVSFVLGPFGSVPRTFRACFSDRMGKRKMAPLDASAEENGHLLGDGIGPMPRGW